jgi:amino acid permease
MTTHLPWRQVLIIILLFCFSFATFYWSFYEFGFPLDTVITVISIIAALGLSFLVYNLLFRFSRSLYTNEMKRGQERLEKEEGKVQKEKIRKEIPKSVSKVFFELGEEVRP